MKHELHAKVKFGVIGSKHNWAQLVKAEKVFGNRILLLDGLQNTEVANAYWKLDGNAFGSGEAPKFMKLDALILGGLAVCIFLHKSDVNPAFAQKIDAQDMEYVPIGFMDMHKVCDGKFTCSGLGIAQQYQGMGLSKLLLYGGIMISGAEEILIPTQLSNAMAHFAWLNLSPLEILKIAPFHTQGDTIIYKAATQHFVASFPTVHKVKIGPVVGFDALAANSALYEGSLVVGYSSAGLIIPSTAHEEKDVVETPHAKHSEGREIRVACS